MRSPHHLELLLEDVLGRDDVLSSSSLPELGDDGVLLDDGEDDDEGVELDVTLFINGESSYTRFT